jgi:DNA-directed RNA polymerase subunit RPC12/RpoP
MRFEQFGYVCTKCRRPVETVRADLEFAKPVSWTVLWGESLVPVCPRCFAAFANQPENDDVACQPENDPGKSGNDPGNDNAR